MRQAIDRFVIMFILFVVVGGVWHGIAMRQELERLLKTQMRDIESRQRTILENQKTIMKFLEPTGQGEW